MHIVTLQHEDVNLLLDVIPEGWEGVLPIIEYYTKAACCYPFKLVIDQKIVGVGAAVLHTDTAWLSHIMIHPGYRERGLGSLITQHLIDFVKGKGFNSIYLIATEMGAPVYSKLGFEIETEYNVCKGEKLAETDFHSDRIIDYKSDYKEQILNLDKQVTGEDRYAYLEEHLLNGQLYVNDEVVEGFYLPSLGDGLIIAISPLAGKELMKIRLTIKDFAIFPQENTIASEFMKEYNFKESYKVKRMVLGKRIKWNPEYLYNRVGGNIG